MVRARGVAFPSSGAGAKPAKSTDLAAAAAAAAVATWYSTDVSLQMNKRADVDQMSEKKDYQILHNENCWKSPWERPVAIDDHCSCKIIATGKKGGECTKV